ncbi:LTA synthase family protein [Peribacillus sp. SCS-155]|uniref:LTA synthase family protein n=1 Tax=Peribacillus sedimenti TaxID=3115297 RepID=UPI0039067204
MKKKIPSIAVLTLLSIFVKTVWVKYMIMDHISIGGVLTESSFIILLCFFIALMSFKFSFMSFLLLNFIYSLLSIIAIMYFDYYNAIITYTALAEMDQVGTIKDSISALFKGTYLWFFSDLILLAFWKKYQGFFLKFEFRLSRERSLWILSLPLLFVVSGIARSSNTISEINKYDHLGFAGYQLIHAASSASRMLQDGAVINAQEIHRKQGALLNKDRKLKGIANDKNIIIVQLESVQNFLIKGKVRNEEITPNLNRFLQEAMYFPRIFTQVGKGNTSDAEFIVNTSIYPLGDIAMSTAAKADYIPSLPRVLKKAGYHSATFHTNNVSFWNRKELYSSVGFEEYFDKAYFGKQDPISYGPSDEVLYRKTVDKLSQYRNSGQKFYAHVIAMSSHFPYHLPDSKKIHTIDLPERYRDSFVGNYIQAVSYADYAFGLFLDHLKEAGLYDNTLIVVYGDHQGVQMKDQRDQDLVQEVLGKDYHSVLDHLNVPLMMKVPGVTGGEQVDMVGGLIDIYPTIANLMNLKTEKEVIFGTDLINSHDNLVGIRFYAPTGTFINKSYSFTPGTKKNEGIMTFINGRKTRQANQHSLKELDYLLKKLEMSDNYVRSLN